MRENKVRTIWRSGNAVANGWLGIPSTVSAEIVARAGYDAVTIDLQHGLVDYTNAVPMLQAMAQTSVTPMVRVPWNEPGIIMKMLDAGAYGIICPMINNRAEAERFIGACRYAPVGYRSFGPSRAVMYAGADYFAKSNETVLAIGMIETQEALDNLDAILTTPGLDGIYVGPSDLGISIGGPAKIDQTDEKVMAAIKTILAAAKKHRIPAGIHCIDPNYARQMVELGFQLVTFAGDMRILADATKAAIDTFWQQKDADTTSGGSSPY